jgi:putative spermidine/putrescine transport system permease protein
MVNYLLPITVLILYAGMRGVDPSLILAAKSLGASTVQAFRRIYVPLVMPTIVTASLIIFVLCLGFFLTPAILGGPRDETIAVYISRQISIYEWGTASAMGILLLSATLAGYALVLRVTGTSGLSSMAVGGGKGAVTRTPITDLFTKIVLWVISLIGVAIMLLPLIVVIPTSFGSTPYVFFPPKGFTLHWYGEVFRDSTWTSALQKSLVVALATAALATLFALMSARSVLSFRSPTARSILYAAAYAPLLVPLILLAIGNFDVQTRLGLIGSNAGLIFVETTLAFPLVFAILVSALSTIDRSLEEAAWTLGASRPRTLWTVVVRSIAPSIVGGFVIAFMTAWDETVVALFQTGLDKTLPVVLYSYLQSGIVSTMPAVASMLIGVVLIGFVLGFLARLNFERRRRSSSILAELSD